MFIKIITAKFSPLCLILLACTILKENKSVSSVITPVVQVPAPSQ